MQGAPKCHVFEAVCHFNGICRGTARRFAMLDEPCQHRATFGGHPDSIEFGAVVVGVGSFSSDVDEFGAMLADLAAGSGDQNSTNAGGAAQAPTTRRGHWAMRGLHLPEVIEIRHDSSSAGQDAGKKPRVCAMSILSPRPVSAESEDIRATSA